MANRRSEANAAVAATIGKSQEALPEAPVAVRRPPVREGWARSMLYLPEPAKRRVQEIAFHARRKENDVYLDAIREYLERHGDAGLL
jgi:hypothetical protein